MENSLNISKYTDEDVIERQNPERGKIIRQEQNSRSTFKKHRVVTIFMRETKAQPRTQQRYYAPKIMKLFTSRV